MSFEAGIQNILVTYPIVSEVKAMELARLAEKAKVSVSLDSREAATILSRQAAARGVRIGVLVELDVGFRRCGLTNEEEVLNLSRCVMDLPALQFRGLMCYPGHMLACEPERRRLLSDVNEWLDRVRQAFQLAGHAIECISGGSTPTAYMSHEFRGVTEICPGMYISNDRNMMGAAGVASVETCAVSLLVTVVSTAVPGRAIVDGGSKTFSSDRYLAGDGRGFGLVKEDPEAEFESMSEEHGHLNISQSARPYRVAERLAIVPNHVCQR